MTRETVDREFNRRIPELSTHARLLTRPPDKEQTSWRRVYDRDILRRILDSWLLAPPPPPHLRSDAFIMRSPTATNSKHASNPEQILSLLSLPNFSRSDSKLDA